MSETKERIGVVGAGLMGAEIAFVHALAGYEVLLNDRSEEALAASVKRLAGIFDKGISSGAYQADHKAPTIARVRTVVDRAAFADRDCVIEAVFERLDVKSEVLADLDKICAPDCVIATNTSTIPIAVLASALALPRRERFIGAHFFSPVSRMKLVEVIPGLQTSEERQRQLCGFARRSASRRSASKTWRALR